MADARHSPGERELDRALSDLGAQVAYPPTPDIASGVARRLATQPMREQPLVWRVRVRTALAPLQRGLAIGVLVLILLAGAAVAASPEVRTAIADRLGLPGVQIQQVPALATQPGLAPPPAAASPPALVSAGTRLNLGQPMTLEQARARVAYPVLVPAALGAPDEVYLQTVPPGGQVALVYTPRADVPQASSTGVGLLLTEFQGSVQAASVIGKGLPPGTNLEDVQIGLSANRGYWVDGDPHVFFYFDATGQVRTETSRLAGSVLLWEQGQLTLRLESALGKEAAVRIAASVQ